ncbi:SDR family NAD(P)-dependent oxidoreductase [Pararhizobium arenae]|uniref:SDR family NAD(P)-dependent oxidoreductase n=1 Tax=Pararhizobium arenae TaxID=1856850 RepID=UPI00094B665D|nr:SDR family NAD(P)-dependent oxidoreductase [Pararhizobium arenae]
MTERMDEVISPGRVAVITGAAKGIGAAVASALSRKGMRLGVLDTDGKALEQFAASLETDTVSVVGDVSETSATISGRAVCKILRLERTTLLGLLSIGAFVNRATGTAIAICAGDLDAFDRKYVSAAQVKRDHGLRRGDFDRRLSESGVSIAFPFEDIGQMILERADVPRLLLAARR